MANTEMSLDDLCFVSPHNKSLTVGLPSGSVESKNYVFTLTTEQKQEMLEALNSTPILRHKISTGLNSIPQTASSGDLFDVSVNSAAGEAQVMNAMEFGTGQLRPLTEIGTTKSRAVAAAEAAAAKPSFSLSDALKSAEK